MCLYARLIFYFVFTVVFLVVYETRFDLLCCVVYLNSLRPSSLSLYWIRMALLVSYCLLAGFYPFMAKKMRGCTLFTIGSWCKKACTALGFGGYG